MPAARYPIVLTQRLGDEAYAALVEMAEDRMETRLTIMSERFERRLTEVGADLRVQIEGVRADMERHHADLVKWAVVFLVGQAATMAGIAIGIVIVMR